MTQHRRRQDQQEDRKRDHVGDPPGLVPAREAAHAVDGLGQRVADDAPLLVVGVAVEGDAERLGAETADTDRKQGAEDHEVLGLVLDADSVWAHRTRADTAGQGPQQAHDEDDAGDVAHQGVPLVDATLEELGRFGELMVDLQRGGDRHEHEEAEVDHRVHDPGHRVTHQGLHVQTGPHVLHALLEVAGGRVSLLGGAPLPVLDPERQLEADVDQQDRDQRVEDRLDRVRDVAEHLAGDRAFFVMEVEDGRGNTRHGGDECDHAPEDDDQLVRSRSARRLGVGLDRVSGLCCHRDGMVVVAHRAAVVKASVCAGDAGCLAPFVPRGDGHLGDAGTLGAWHLSSRGQTVVVEWLTQVSYMSA